MLVQQFNEGEVEGLNSKFHFLGYRKYLWWRASHLLIIDYKCLITIFFLSLSLSFISSCRYRAIPCASAVRLNGQPGRSETSFYADYWHVSRQPYPSRRSKWWCDWHWHQHLGPIELDSPAYTYVCLCFLVSCEKEEWDMHRLAQVHSGTLLPVLLDGEQEPEDLIPHLNHTTGENERLRRRNRPKSDLELNELQVRCVTSYYILNVNYVNSRCKCNQQLLHVHIELNWGSKKRRSSNDLLLHSELIHRWHREKKKEAVDGP